MRGERVGREGVVAESGAVQFAEDERLDRFGPEVGQVNSDFLQTRLAQFS
jgi:hypothetical protein